MTAPRRDEGAGTALTVSYQPGAIAIHLADEHGYVAEIYVWGDRSVAAASALAHQMAAAPQMREALEMALSQTGGWIRAAQDALAAAEAPEAGS